MRKMLLSLVALFFMAGLVVAVEAVTVKIEAAKEAVITEEAILSAIGEPQIIK